jgi:hypothetical protein
MKTSMFTLCLVLMGYDASAQKLSENQVPPAVIKAFKVKYSAVQNVRWEKENKDYEAGFKINEIETSVLLDVAGNFLETESEIAHNALPKAIADAVAKNYADYEIEETSRIETGGIVSYEVEVEKEKKSMDLIFDQNGKLLKALPIEEKTTED